MISIPRNDTSVFGRWWWTVDRWLLAVILLLATIGLILTATASPPVAERIGADSMYFLRKQIVILFPAIAILVSVSMLDLRQVRRLAAFMLFGSIVFMIATLFVGTEIKGATRWISLAGFSLQPSEFAKPAFAVLAGWFLAARRTGEAVPGYAITVLIYVLLTCLLLLQPDFGQALLLTAVAAVQLFLNGLPMALVIALVVFGVLALVAAYYGFDHVASRIDRFLDPKSGDSYQVDRATDAFQSGGLFGRGPGEGIVKNNLPDSHADFIFAVAGEEFGLFVCLIIVGLFVFVVLRAFTRVFQENDLFVLLAGAGLIVQFGLQAIINMASTMSIIPTKGMTLPFISYGGSSLIALALAMGMLLALTRRRPGIASWRN